MTFSCFADTVDTSHALGGGALGVSLMTLAGWLVKAWMDNGKEKRKADADKQKLALESAERLARINADKERDIKSTELAFVTAQTKEKVLYLEKSIDEANCKLDEANHKLDDCEEKHEQAVKKIDECEEKHREAQEFYQKSSQDRAELNVRLSAVEKRIPVKAPDSGRFPKPPPT